MSQELEEKIIETRKHIVFLKENIEKNERFKKLTDNELFIEFFTNGLLGDTMNNIALGLTAFSSTDEDDQKTLDELKSLRKIKQFIASNLNTLVLDKKELIENEEYLSKLLTGEE